MWTRRTCSVFLGPQISNCAYGTIVPTRKLLKNVVTLVVGEENPKSVLIPAGVVHAYQNVGEVPGIVFNCPNRLYMGQNKKEPVDEIRHEDDPDTIYRMED